jgi:hypothetical protein
VAASAGSAAIGGDRECEAEEAGADVPLWITRIQWACTGLLVLNVALPVALYFIGK